MGESRNQIADDQSILDAQIYEQQEGRMTDEEWERKYFQVKAPCHKPYIDNKGEYDNDRIPDDF